MPGTAAAPRMATSVVSGSQLARFLSGPCKYSMYACRHGLSSLAHEVHDLQLSGQVCDDKLCGTRVRAKVALLAVGVCGARGGKRPQGKAKGRGRAMRKAVPGTDVGPARRAASAAVAAIGKCMGARDAKPEPRSSAHAPPMTASSLTLRATSVIPSRSLCSSGGERRSAARLVSIPTEEIITERSGCAESVRRYTSMAGGTCEESLIGDGQWSASSLTYVDIRHCQLDPPR
eukprot:3605739-Prymnesium_polylepis.1